MKSPYAMFSTDKELEKEKGVTLDFGAFKIRILRAGGANEKFKNLLKARLKPHKFALDHGTMDNDELTKILAEVYAETIVLGWEDVVDAEGKPLPFNKANCVKLFTDLPELFESLQEESKKLQNFQREELEETAKNSGRSSAGK